jgi:hypothetical protein
MWHIFLQQDYSGSVYVLIYYLFVTYLSMLALAHITHCHMINMGNEWWIGVDTEGDCHGVVLGTNLALWRRWEKNHEEHKTWWLVARSIFGPDIFHGQVRHFICIYIY